MNRSMHALALAALVVSTAAAGCNDDLLAYRLARLADADADTASAGADSAVAETAPVDAGGTDAGAADIAAADGAVAEATVADSEAEVVPPDVPVRRPGDGDGDSPGPDLPGPVADTDADAGEVVLGECQFLLCNDGNPCTVDGCEVDKCVFLNAEGPCEDGDFCTISDTCAQGSCQPGPLKDCNDNQPCSVDSCEKKTGCNNVPNDGGKCQIDTCTTDGICIGPDCVGATPVDCDDENACTDDSCDPKQGCVHANKAGAPCDDGSNCTLDDTCADGKCKPGKGCDANAICVKDPELGALCVCGPGFSGDGWKCVGK